MSSKTALVLVANGSEEMEAVISIDVLRRAQVYSMFWYIFCLLSLSFSASVNLPDRFSYYFPQIDVTVVGLDLDIVKCSRDVQIKPDKSISDVKNVS